MLLRWHVEVKFHFVQLIEHNFLKESHASVVSIACQDMYAA